VIDVFVFPKAISQLFEELQDSNLEFKLITPKSIFWTNFGIMVAILDFLKAISQLFEEPPTHLQEQGGARSAPNF